MHKDVPDGIDWTGLGIAYNGQQLDIKGDDLKTGNLDPSPATTPTSSSTMELVRRRPRPEGRPDPALAPGAADHQAGQQARDAPRAEGPRLGRRHRRPEEHEPRLGQQRGAVAQHARRPTSATSSSPRWSATRSSARSASCRSWTGSRGSSRGARAARTRSGSGSTTRSSSPPTRWRWTTSSGGSSTPSGRRRASRRSPPPARWASTRWGPRGSTSASRSTSRLAANLGLGIFDFKSPRGRRQSIDHRVDRRRLTRAAWGAAGALQEVALLVLAGRSPGVVQRGIPHELPADQLQRDQLRDEEAEGPEPLEDLRAVGAEDPPPVGVQPALSAGGDVRPRAMKSSTRVFITLVSSGSRGSTRSRNWP